VDQMPEQSAAVRELGARQVPVLLVAQAEGDELLQAARLVVEDAEGAVAGVDQVHRGGHDAPQDDGELQFPAQREDGGEQARHALLVRRRPRVPARGAVRVGRLPWWGRLRASPTVVPRHDHPPLSGPGARRSVSAAHLIVTRVPASRTQEPPGSRRPPAVARGPPGGRAGTSAGGGGRKSPRAAAGPIMDGMSRNTRSSAGAYGPPTVTVKGRAIRLRTIGSLLIVAAAIW